MEEVDDPNLVELVECQIKKVEVIDSEVIQAKRLKKFKGLARNIPLPRKRTNLDSLDGSYLVQAIN